MLHAFAFTLMLGASSVVSDRGQLAAPSTETTTTSKERASPTAVPSYQFPFPANESTVIFESSQDGPAQNLTVDLAPISVKTSKTIIVGTHKSCGSFDKNYIAKAFEEARTLALAQTTFRSGYNYDIPHTQWLGSEWNSRGGFFSKNYRIILQDNFGRLERVFREPPQTDYQTYIIFYCGNGASSDCRKNDKSTGFFQESFWGTTKYVYLCDKFFDTWTLEALLTYNKRFPDRQKDIDVFYNFPGRFLFALLYKFKYFVASPTASEYAESPIDVWNLAKNKGTYWAYVNSNSYALDALAIAVQQFYKSPMSPVPWAVLHETDAAAASAFTPNATEPGIAYITGLIPEANPSAIDFKTLTVIHP